MRLENSNNYPRTCAVLKDIKTLCLFNSRIWHSFQIHTNITRSGASNLLSIGTHPDLIPVANLTSGDGYTAYGIFQPSYNTEAIRIRKNIIQGIEIAKLEETIYATAFFFAITILHELVHYCRYQKKLKSGKWEYGLGFERGAIGLGIELDNAGKKYMAYKQYFENLHNEIKRKKV